MIPLLAGLIRERFLRSGIFYKSIIIYDQFFKEKNKKSVIVHESSHHIYKNLGPDGVKEFVDLSAGDLRLI